MNLQIWLQYFPAFIESLLAFIERKPLGVSVSGLYLSFCLSILRAHNLLNLEINQFLVAHLSNDGFVISH